MNEKTFARFRNLIYERSGINLREGKEALVCARVSKRMRTLGIENYCDYLDVVISDSSGAEIVQLLDAISTNVTSFFRENEHFCFLRDEIEKWIQSGTSRLRIWSAACSTGEEPYSIAMTVFDSVQNPKQINLKILATDISTRALGKAQNAAYSEEKVQSINPFVKDKCFDKILTGDGEKLYQVKSDLRNSVLFCRLNLSETPYPMQGPFDLIFCRNVMIYFDNAIRRKLLDEMYRLIKPGGYFIVGHAESLTGMMSSFKCIKPSIYIRK